jgi:hypothetical protein
MDRFFLAIIISGLLLAAVATSLFVATGGGNSVAVLDPPRAPVLPTEKIGPRRGHEDRTMPRDDGRK